jgi:glycosyltransferase involved in cell wall biosynthesis
MINNPYFSIIIPTYNRSEKVRQVIQSILCQTFSDFEVLIMDDGSNDNTCKVVEGFKDPRIHYCWAENSGGPATPRNRGIETARGEWICFLDADDLWYPNKLEIVAKAIAANPDADVFCHHEILSVLATERKSLLRHGPFEADFYRVMLTQGNRVSTSATTVRRNFLDTYGLRFNQSHDYVIIEDYDLWLHIARYDGHFHFINLPLGEYVIENDNLTANSTRHRHNLRVLLHDHVYHIQSFEPEKNKLWRQIRVRLSAQEAKEQISQGRFGTAACILANAWATSPRGGVRYVSSWIRRQIRKLSPA